MTVAKNPARIGGLNWRIDFFQSALWLMIATYIAWFSFVSFRNQDLFMTNGFDLGLFDHIIWNNLHRNFFSGTFIGEPSFLALHFQPILVPLSLIYLIWPDAKALLFIQTLALGLGALPIFWLASGQISRLAGLVFALTYLLFPALEGANLFEFHPVALAPGLLAFAYWYLWSGSFKTFLLFGILAAACKQEIFLIVGMMGLYLFVCRRDRRGLAVAAASFTAFLLISSLIIPSFSFRETHFAIHRYRHLGDSMGEVVLTILTRPVFVWNYLWSDPNRVRYVTHLLAPVAYLSLLDPLTLLIAFPTVALNLLADLPVMHVLDQFHYSAVAVPFVVASAVNGLTFLTRFLHNKRGFPKTFLNALFLPTILCATVVYHVRFGDTPLTPGFQLPAVEERHRAAYQMLALIPPQVTVSAQTALSPHLTHRPGAYLFPHLDSSQYGPADYIVLDLSGNIYPLVPESFNAMVTELKESGDYSIVYEQDGYLLLQRR